MNNFIDIDFKMIKEKHPKSFEKFIKENEYIYYFDVQKNLHIKKYYEIDSKYEIDVCCCDIKNFFDKNSIFIEDKVIYDDYINCLYYCAEIYHFSNEKLERIAYTNDCETRKEALEQSFIYAFKFMEGKLNEL